MEAVGYGVVECCKCLWGSVATPISYISDPAKNLRSLKIELQRLMNKSADIERMVEAEEVAKLKERTSRVDGWLKEVKDLKAECEEVLQEGNSHQHNKCLVWCRPGNCRSSHKLGEKLCQLLNAVRECQAAGQFDEVVIALPPPRVHAMPMEKTVGLDCMVSQVWGCLQAEDVGIIGLYGMGGVGKTTLMKRINEELRCTSHAFDVVRWIVVSKQVNLDKIRESIRKGLGILEDVWREKFEDERAGILYKVLSRKKFVLLIDDIWEQLDLSRIGIPIPNQENGSKIVFTTRLEEVCGQMEAKKSIRVQCLTSEQALELFKEKVGRETLNVHHHIPGIAELIVEECKGLPLALITIGRAMATKKDTHEWKYALNVLGSYPSNFSNMVDHVYKLLELSYHSLKNSTLQQCFLFCALFPEDYDIKKDHLIDLWIGEGFLCDTNDVYEARLEGQHVYWRVGRMKIMLRCMTGIWLCG